MTTRGRFLTLEGIEGAGKTTALESLRCFLADRGRRVVVTREPGGTPLGEDIRTVLLQPRDEPVDAFAETLLVFAARAQHVAAVIEPALRRGDWVLCDRFTDSTFAYQVGGRGVDAKAVAWLAERVHGGCWPDLTLYLDVPAHAGLARARSRDAEPAPIDRFEREQLGFFERVRTAYRERAAQHERIVSIDASQDAAAVRRDVQAAVERLGP